MYELTGNVFLLNPSTCLSVLLPDNAFQMCVLFFMSYHLLSNDIQVIDTSHYN